MSIGRRVSYSLVLLLVLGLSARALSQTDPRTLTAECNTELERMGDYAKGIARICLMMGDEPHVKPLIDIPRMAELTVDMLHRALGAFVQTDVEEARKIPKANHLYDF